MGVSKASRTVQPEWLDLKAIEDYACVSERTIREWIHRPVNPLQASQAGGGKILIKRSHLDAWLEAHPYQPIDSLDVEQVTDEIMQQLGKAA